MVNTVSGITHLNRTKQKFYAIHRTELVPVSSGFSHAICNTIAELRLRENANDRQFGELIAKRHCKKIKTHLQW
jgi:hypothetical protein